MTPAMRRSRLLLTGCALLAVAGCGSSGSTPTTTTAAAGGLASIGAGLQGPPGVRATVYATGLRQLSAFAFDAQGRLWVTTSGAATHGTDGVYLVAARGARPVKVVSGLRGPLGLLWRAGTLDVSSLGRVDAFSGLHGTRFAARRRILAGPVPGGENNNIVLAPDGRILMGISASCDHCTPKSKWSASIVSFRPDGGGLLRYASGIRAAFGLAFYPGTSDLFASMNQRDDLGARTPGDWLGLVRKGQDWGFPGCYGQGGAICAGVPAPVAVLGKHAAAGGVAIVTRRQLGGRFAPSALVAEWQLGRVLRVPLTRTGSGYRGPAVPFLTGVKNPLPLLVTRSGSVLVGDWSTGKIYEIAGR
jgi:glucose/arabinose dehydrogenase